ncbi:ATP-binding protein [Streptomyces sp. NBC_00386]|jgi:anti-sigma regulatory factor (Ser/Thr protein kinase)|uniref:ATP-binding protein n=1 Tax=Streptomyces sp. NBC_00386 TaxID=2975734 RepID=UPI002E24A235
MPVTTAAPAPLTDPTRSPSPVADHQLTVALPYGLRTPQVARQITARWLAAYVAPASRMCNVVLIVSELVTNAIRHTREPCTLKLTLHGSRLDVAVADHGETLPETSSTPGEHGGFGLPLIEGLGGRITTVPALGGKTVHATLTVTPFSGPHRAPPTTASVR